VPGAERMGALWGSPLPGLRVTIDAENAQNKKVHKFMFDLYVLSKTRALNTQETMRHLNYETARAIPRRQTMKLLPNKTMLLQFDRNNAIYLVN
jgi:hypothetical protein